MEVWKARRGVGDESVCFSMLLPRCLVLQPSLHAGVEGNKGRGEQKKTSEVP